jgi:TRAP transporter 4TM/12TM fusion protein
VEIVKAAVIPADLYFPGVWLGVHFEAKRKNLKGMPREELPKAWDIFRERGHLALPLVVIVYLLVSGYTPMRAALFAIVLSILASSLRKSTRMRPIDVVIGLEKGAKAVLGVLVACASAGIIIGVVTKTGVGLKLASALLSFAGGMMLPTMFFTMITALLLGMGVPTTANYVITSTIASPALVQMGIPVLAAHMFVFYFGIIADVTPPVALAAYAGAAISGGNALKTGVNASKLAIAAFIIPYIFAFNPAMLFINTTFLQVVLVILTSALGMLSISVGMIGYFVKEMAWPFRILCVAGGLLMIYPGPVPDIIGIVILVAVFVIERLELKKKPA